jgi:hypothetical protein
MKLSNLVVQAAAIASLVLATCPVSAAQTRPDPSQFDMMGLKLGMSPDEAQATIRAHDPKILIQAFKVKGVDGKIFIQVVHAIMHPDRREIMASEEIFVLFTQTQPGRAFAIGHALYFVDGQEPLKTAVLKQLFDKYGSPTDDQYSPTYSWLFDNSNQPLHRARNPSPEELQMEQRETVCRQHNGQSVSMVMFLPLDAARTATGASLALPTNFSPDCGVNLTVILSFDFSNPDLISLLSQVLFDDRIAVADITKVQSAQRALQQQLQNQQNKQAAGIKPQL